MNLSARTAQIQRVKQKMILVTQIETWQIGLFEKTMPMSGILIETSIWSVTIFLYQWNFIKALQEKFQINSEIVNSDDQLMIILV